MKRGLKFLLIADAWATLALGMLGPIYAIFVEEIGGNILDASWAFFTFTLTSGLLIFAIGKWEDRFKHKEKLVLFGYVLISIGTLGYVFVYNQISLLIVQVILGVAVALLSPAYDSLYSHFVIKKEEAYDWGTWEAMGYIVTAIAAVMGGYIADLVGFKILFLTMFFVSLLGVLTSAGLLKSKKYLNSERER